MLLHAVVLAVGQFMIDEFYEAFQGLLVDFCRDRLAHYKCPRRVEFVDQLPRQDNGKIYKRLLRDRYRERAST